MKLMLQLNSCLNTGSCDSGTNMDGHQDSERILYLSWVIFLNVSQFQPDLWPFILVFTCHGSLYIHHFIQLPASTQQLIYSLFSAICKVQILNFDLSEPSSQTINNKWSLKISAALVLITSVLFIKILQNHLCKALCKCQKSNWPRTAHRPVPCADH